MSESRHQNCFKPYGDIMKNYDDKQFEIAVDTITEQLSCIILCLVNRSLETIKSDLLNLNASLAENTESGTAETDF